MDQITGTGLPSQEMERLREIVRAIDFCMMTTVASDGTPHTRPMASHGEIDDAGDVWLFSAISSHKIDELQGNPHVTVAFSDSVASRFAVLVGTAELVRDPALIHQYWRPNLSQWFPQGATDPDLALIRVSTTHADYWEGATAGLSFLSSAVRRIFQPDHSKHGIIEL